MRRCYRYVTVVLLTLLIAGVAAGALAGSGGASDAPTVDVATSADASQVNVNVDVSHRFSLAPDEPNVVYVETTIDPASAYSDLRLNFTENNAYYMAEPTNFTQDGQEWVLDDGVTNASFTAAIHTHNATFSGANADSALVIFPMDDWAEYETASDFTTTRHVERTVDGTGAVRDDKALLGSYQRYTETASGTTFELLVSDSATLQPSPDDVVGSIANASEELEGESDKSVALLAVPDYLGVPGYGGDTSVAIEDHNAMYTPDNTWIHEYVHATDDIWKGSEMAWFTEGYAEYEATRLSLEQDFASYQEFRDWLEFDDDQFEPATLSEPATWDGVDSTDLYGQGSLALGEIDLRIRQTEGNATLQDVVADMHQHSGPVSLADFEGFVADHGNQSVADRAETLITTETIGETWSIDTHQSAFGTDLAQPSAEISIDATDLDVGESVYMAEIGDAGEGDLESVDWDFDDGTTASGTLVQHAWDEAGVYTVEVTLTNSLGQSDAATVEVTVGDVTNDPPTVDLSGAPSDAITTSDTVDLSADASDDGTIASYEWDFGDGTSATGAAPSHSYDAAGTYDVTVTVTDDQGATSTDSATITVESEQEPHGEIDPSTTSASVGESVSFSIQSNTDWITGQQWEMGDGTTHSDTWHVSHSFDSPGSYTVTLETTSGYDGSQTTDTVTVEVS